jgi:hypothetical protein
MNRYQEMWWEQSRSDHKVLVMLRNNGAEPCQQLHYLQMATEKLAKAYFWRSGAAPPKSHSGFVQFMRALGGVQQLRQAQIAGALEFNSFVALQVWIHAVLPLVYQLERLAPAMAQNGPNPEYPWPHDAPIECPVRHQFVLWGQMTNTGLGRQLTRAIRSAVNNFPAYG